MNLALDIGNTRVKAALFNNEALVEMKWFNSANEFFKDTIFIKKATQAIIGTVVEGSEQVIEALNQVIPTQLFSADTTIPLHNLYQSASTLGSDRLAASIGGFAMYPHANVLVIDCGTCIKYNFTNAANQYLGGAISPGVAMRFKALHQFTSKLPLVEADHNYTALVGTTTQNSILSGVINGCSAEIDGFISLYKEQYPDLICVITGGDGEHLAKRLKNSIFTHQNLVLKGLNHILYYQSSL